MQVHYAGIGAGYAFVHFLRLRVIATVQDPAVVRTILAHLGLAAAARPSRPAPRAPAALA